MKALWIRGGRKAALLAGLITPVLLTAQPDAMPDLQGVYVETLTSLEDPRWRLENLLCRRCTLEAIELTRQLLADPGNDTRSLEDLQREVRGYNRDFIAGLLTAEARRLTEGYDQADDPVLDCRQPGLFRATGPLPIQIEQHADRVVLRYEYFNAVRTVHVDGSDHPADPAPSPLGHSIGWYDGPTLVVETVAIEPHILGGAGIDGLRTSPEAVGIERFTRSEDGQHLDIDATIVDPRMLTRPVTFREARLLAPGGTELETVLDPCEAY